MPLDEVEQHKIIIELDRLHNQSGDTMLMGGQLVASFELDGALRVIEAGGLLSEETIKSYLEHPVANT